MQQNGFAVKDGAKRGHARITKGTSCDERFKDPKAEKAKASTSA